MNETSKNQRKKSLLGQLSDLAVGEELTVPVSRSSYLKSICVSFGLQWDKKFSTSTPRRAHNHSNKNFITLTLQ